MQTKYYILTAPIMNLKVNTLCIDLYWNRELDMHLILFENGLVSDLNTAALKNFFIDCGTVNFPYEYRGVDKLRNDLLFGNIFEDVFLSIFATLNRQGRCVNQN